MLSQYKSVSLFLQYLKFKFCSRRLIAEKEVEEAKKREAAAAEKALAELEESAKTLKGKPRKGALSKKDASGIGPSPKRSLLVNKEAPKREPSSERGPQGSRA